MVGFNWTSRRAVASIPKKRPETESTAAPAKASPVMPRSSDLDFTGEESNCADGMDFSECEDAVCADCIGGSVNVQGSILGSKLDPFDGALNLGR